MRLLTALCVTAVVVAFAVPAFAETQNVKVSGDIAVASIFQNNIDLNDAYIGGNIDNENDNENLFVQQVGLNVGADLTDNVSTFVRIINERDWNAEDQSTNGFDVSLDEAYLTLKEMLYAPLTLKIGRQNIWLGKGLVVGNAGSAVWDTSNALNPTIDELSDMTAFDALRGTLDYDPWTIDLIYAKIDKNATDNAADLVNDDIDLYVANVGYKFTKYDAEAETYYILKHDKTLRDAATATSAFGDANEVHTIGLRGSYVPFDYMNVWAEGAVQVGKYASTSREVDREAYAFNAGGIYNFVDVRWTPKLGVEYLHTSGENVDADGNATGDWEAWEPLYRGKFDNYIADFRNITKVTDYDTARVVSANANNHGTTNENQVAVIGALNPMTDVTFDARLAFFWFDQKPLNDVKDDIGSELDLKLTYDYTEDVVFTVAAGVFFPGDYYPSTYTTGGIEYNPNKTAAQVISAVKVEF